MRISLCSLFLLLLMASGSFAALERTSPYDNYKPFLLFKANGNITVSVAKDGGWVQAGTLEYDKYYRERTLDLSAWAEPGKPLAVRLHKSGGGASQIDAALLDDSAPLGVGGGTAGLHKLLGRDFDVLPLEDGGVEISFAPASGPAVLDLTARIEPEVLSEFPFQLPLANIAKPMTTESEFFTYTLGSHHGSLNMDGLLDEGLTSSEPFWKEYVTSGSGHPSADVYTWVRNDSEALYVSMDFIGDNTTDGDKDYAKFYVNTGGGLKEFKISELQRQWGEPGFGYTDLASWEHKTYEFRIPFAELGLAPQTGTPLQVAFAGYGTFSPAITNLAVTKTDGLATVEPGGALTYTIQVSNLGPNGVMAAATDAIPAPLTVTSATCTDDGGTLSDCITDNGSGNLVDWSFMLSNGGSVTIEVECEVPAGAANTLLSNTATLNAGIYAQWIGDPDTSNNEAIDTTQVLGSTVPVPIFTPLGMTLFGSLLGWGLLRFRKRR